MSRNESGALRRLQFRAEYLALRALAAVVGLLPEKLAVRAGVWLGRALWLLAPRRRRIARENIEKAMPGERTPAEVARLVKDVFVNIGLTTTENLWMQKPSHRESLRDRMPISGIDGVARALEGGHGMLALTSHLGNWELFGGALAANLGKINALARPVNNPFVRAYTTRMREALGMTVLSTRDGVRPMIAALRRGEFLGILTDQHVNRAFVPATFFGRPAATTAVTASLALRLGAPVFVAWSVRDGRSFRHQGRLEGPVELVRTGDKEADIAANTQQFNDRIEAVVRERPEQWLWTHRRWKLADRSEQDDQKEQAEHVG